MSLSTKALQRPQSDVLWVVCSVNRFLGRHLCYRGSGRPSRVPLILQALGSQPGSGPAQCLLRSNRSGPAGRQPACWWWSSLSLPSATCPSAYSTSWKGNSLFGCSVSLSSGSIAITTRVHHREVSISQEFTLGLERSHLTQITVVIHSSPW